LDAGKLLTMVIRHCTGKPKAWSVVHVPSVAAEDQRQLHRDLEEMKAEQTPHRNRLKGILVSGGLAVQDLPPKRRDDDTRNDLRREER
jgi:transposase